MPDNDDRPVLAAEALGLAARRWGVGEHKADLTLWAEAGDEAGVYEAAVLALGQTLAAGPAGQAAHWHTVELAGEPAELLVGLLGEVVYLWDARGWLPASARVELGLGRLRARLGCETLAQSGREPDQAVKAVTYHQAQVRRLPGGGWRAQVVLDV